MVSLNSLRGAKALASSPSLENLIAGVGLAWSVAFECTSCVDGLVFLRSKIENILISGIGGALGIILSTDTVALELNVSFDKFNDPRMEVIFLESPPLGLKIPI